MAKVITSPVKKFPGTVTLRESVTFPDIFAWRKAYNAAEEFTTPGDEPGRVIVTDDIAYRHALLPGVLPLIESHTLAGVPDHLTADNFPARPVRSAVHLVSWLCGEVAVYLTDEGEVPNE